VRLWSRRSLHWSWSVWCDCEISAKNIFFFSVLFFRSCRIPKLINEI
jgi:hypothetical protein